METVMTALTVLVVAGLMLKLSCGGRAGILCVSLAASLSLWFMLRYAIELPAGSVIAWLEDRSHRLDLAVLIALEAMLMLTYCLEASRCENEDAPGKFARTFVSAMRLFPGLLIFPVLFYMEHGAVCMLPGKDFALVGGVMAIAPLIIIPGCVTLLKILIPDEGMRYELFASVELLIACVGVACTVGGSVAAPSGMDVSWEASAAVAGGIIALMCAGAAKYRYFTIRKIRDRG